MSFKDAIRRSVLEGFISTDMPTSQVVVTLLITFLIGLYIYFIYRMVNNSSLYDRSFHTAMAVISVVTAGIIIAMQSSIVISLGMVGALSIVRFRTAVKDSMDLLFLFWSIGEGIICGAGLYEIAVIVALMVTVGILVLEYIPIVKRPYLLIINSSDTEIEDRLKGTIDSLCKNYKVKSRNLKKTGLDMVFEIRTDKEKELLNAVAKLDGVVNVSLLSHEGEVRY